MRVEAANLLSDKAVRIEFPWKDATGDEYLDLRENPSTISQIAAARENPPFARLLLELNGEDSLFRTVRAKVWAEAAQQAAGEDSFHSRMDLIFAHEPFNTMPGHFEDVVRRLVELWMKDGSADALAARLEILPCTHEPGARLGGALRITLVARGANAEQARTRWALGVVRLQQALLFVSRAMKQKLLIEP